jgi:starvation-inducible outer membrane lipoprotein
MGKPFRAVAVALLAVTLLMAGCASLPRDVQRTPSTAIPASRRHRARPHRRGVGGGDRR